MRSTSLFTSAAVLTTLLATGAYYNAAWAQKGTALAPITKWAITKVDGAEAQGGAYCALARRFRQNTILTVARNQDSETSVALDFQTNKLSTAENIKIVLDPGAGEQRSYYITPISDQAFVVRLGRDNKFFDALKTTGFLRVDAGGDSYTFNLEDIDAGSSQLDSCLVSIGGSASAPRGEDMRQANAPVQTEIESLRQDVENLRRENMKLSGLADRGDAGDGGGYVTEHLSGEAEELQQENARLREQVSLSGVSAGQAYGDASALNSLERENMRLKGELASMQLHWTDDDMRSLRQKVSVLESENRDLRSDLSTLPDAGKFRQNQAELFTLKEENRRLQNLLENRGNIVVADNVQSELENLRSENERLSGDLLESRQKLAQAEVQPPPAIVAPPVVAAPALQQKVDELLAQLRQKDEKLVEMSHLTLEVENLKARNKELEEKLAAVGADPGKIAELNEKIRNLEEENNRLITQLQQANANADAKPDAKLAELTKENTDLKQQIESMKSNAKDAEALHVEVEKLRQENETLKNARPEQIAEITETDHAELEKLRKENEELKQKLSELNSQVAEASALRDKLAEQTKKTETLETELKKAAENTAKPEGAAASPTQCVAQVDKIKRDAEVKKQSDMQALARENIGLKRMLSKYVPPQESGQAYSPAAAARAGAAEKLLDAKEMPITVKSGRGADEPWQGYEPVTEAQQQEQRMIHALKEEPSAAKPKSGAKGEDIAWNAPPLEKAAPPPVRKTSQPPVDAMAHKAPVEMPAQKGPAFKPAFSIPDTLVSAKIVPANAVHVVDKVSGPGKVAYQWESGAVYGSAEQVPLGDAAAFDSEVKKYLEKTQKRCPGDFAVAPDNTVSVDSGRVDSYEIACVGKNVSSSASLLFINKSGSFTVMAHEAPTDKMAEAMSMRDRVLKAISGS